MGCGCRKRQKDNSKKILSSTQLKVLRKRIKDAQKKRNKSKLK